MIHALMFITGWLVLSVICAALWHAYITLNNHDDQ